MLRRSIFRALCVSFFVVFLSVGCDSGSGSVSTAPVAHTPESATPGHKGAAPAGGDDMAKNIAKLKNGAGASGPTAR